jgi:hypothetical protein
MTKIEVYGYGVSLSLTEITPELAKQLTETGITDENFDELEINELEDTDEDECGITLNLEVHVDSEKIANPYEGFSGIEQAKDVRSYQLGQAGKCYYVKMMEEDGLWLTLEINKPFDPEKLQIEIFDYVLPDKSTIRLAEPSYAGTGDNFGFTDVKVQDHCVICADGSRHDIEFLDE